MTPTLLREAGESLYGALWQSALARDLGVNDRTVRRWGAGDSKIPAGVEFELSALLVARRVDISAVLRNLALENKQLMERLSRQVRIER